MLQRSDQRYAELLNRARDGSLTSDDINLLKTIIIDSPLPPFNDAVHIYPTLKKVNEYNFKKLVETQEQILTISATHEYTNIANSANKVVLPKHIPDDDRKAGGLPNILTLSINSRVILLRNILTQEGLVNGQEGTVTGFEFCSSTQQPNIVYVKFDDPTVGMNLKLSSMNNAIAIEPISCDYICQGHTVTRTNCPLTKSWSLSVHKLQGCIKKFAVMDLGDEIF